MLFLMVNIKLYDGTRNLNAGKILKVALEDLANYRPVYINPKPGSWDVPGFNLVKKIEQQSYDPSKKKVNFDKFIDLIDRTQEMQNLSTEKIIIIESDLFSAGLNWFFGRYISYNNKDYVIVSTSRIQNKFHLFDIFAHELGHMYGAAKRGRSNTEENIGSHCINDLCVMQQRLTVKESLDYVNQRHKANAQTYCFQCQDDLRSRNL